MATQFICVKCGHRKLTSEASASPHGLACRECTPEIVPWVDKSALDSRPPQAPSTRLFLRIVVPAAMLALAAWGWKHALIALNQLIRGF